MKELITRDQADILLTALPLLGLVAGGIGYALRKAPLWLGVAGGSLLVGVLWRVFNAIADRLGLDSLAQLGLNVDHSGLCFRILCCENKPARSLSRRWADISK